MVRCSQSTMDHERVEYEPMRVLGRSPPTDDDDFQAFLFFSTPGRKRRGWCVPQRYVLAIMGFLAIANGYIQRFCLSLAITEMVVPHHATGGATAVTLDPHACPYDPPENLTLVGASHITSSAEFTWSEETQGVILSAVFWGYVLTQLPGGLLAVLTLGLLTIYLSMLQSAEFTWSEETQGVILSAVFWGYVLTQLPGGLLAERYGGKHVLTLGLLTSTLGTLLTPWAARMGPACLVAVRFCIGLGQLSSMMLYSGARLAPVATLTVPVYLSRVPQGPMYPSLNVMLAQWAPPQERGRLGAVVFAGAQIGNVVSMALGGLLIRYMDGGWVNVFYVFGCAGLVWLAAWQVLCYSDPQSHPFISDSERDFLMGQSVGHLKRREDVAPTPWRHILSSTPLWGLIIAQIGHDWGLFTIITDLPKYMKTVLHFSIHQNGMLSAAPYLVMWVFALISGVLVDFLVKRNVSITLVRKIFISIAATGPALGILAASYSGCDKLKVALFFTVGMGLMGAFVPSLKVNALDLSPNYAGTLMALVGGVGAISGIFTPYLVGVLTPDGTLLQWRLVFWIAVIVLVATNIVYLFMGSAEVQPWNDLAWNGSGIATGLDKSPVTKYTVPEVRPSRPNIVPGLDKQHPKNGEAIVNNT